MNVSFPSRDGSFHIHGTLQLPSSDQLPEEKMKKNIPVVIIVSGSGPIDRDGNVRGGLFTNMDINTTNRLSQFISSSIKNGMAVLSYDKRGIGKSISPTDSNLYYRAGVWDLVSDVVEAMKYLAITAERTGIDEKNIFLMGHSEGAILLPLIVKQCRMETDNSINEKSSLSSVRPPIPKGLVFLSGFGECIRDVMRYQQQILLDEVAEQKGFNGWILRQVITEKRLEKQYEDMMKKISNGGDNSELEDYTTMYCGLVKIPAKWMREHLALGDLRAELKEFTKGLHTLAIAGGNDRQVRSDKFCSSPYKEILVHPEVASFEAHVLPNMTHVLRPMDSPCELLKAKKEYTRMGKLPLDEDLLSTLKQWFEQVQSV